MKRFGIVLLATLAVALASSLLFDLKRAGGAAHATIQVLDHLGNIIGTGGATAGPAPSEQVNVVDSTNHIIDQFGALTSVYPNTAPAAGQVPVGNAGGTAYVPQSLSQDCTMTSAGVVTCTQAGNGAGGFAARSFALNGSGSGTITEQTQAAAGTYNWNFPTTAGTAGQVLTSQGGGATAMTWTATEDHFGTSGALGGLTSTAGATLLQTCVVATNAGHFVNLDCTNDLNGGACTTAPTFNVRDNTGATTGTQKACGTTAGTVDQAETLTFNAGDTICIVRTVNGGTCTAPNFSVQANITYP